MTLKCPAVLRLHEGRELNQLARNQNSRTFSGASSVSLGIEFLSTRMENLVELKPRKGLPLGQTPHKSCPLEICIIWTWLLGELIGKVLQLERAEDLMAR